MLIIFSTYTVSAMKLYVYTRQWPPWNNLYIRDSDRHEAICIYEKLYTRRWPPWSYHYIRDGDRHEAICIYEIRVYHSFRGSIPRCFRIRKYVRQLGVENLFDLMLFEINMWLLWLINTDKYVINKYCYATQQVCNHCKWFNNKYEYGIF